MSKKFLKFAALVAVLTLAFTSGAWADGYTQWTNASKDFYWSNVKNWEQNKQAPNSVPTEVQFTNLQTAAGSPIYVSGDTVGKTVVNSVDVEKNNIVEVAISSKGVATFQISGDVTLGDNASLTFQNYSNDLGAVIVSSDKNAKGVITLTVGTGSTLAFNTSFDFGTTPIEKKGKGTLTLANTVNTFHGVLSIDSGVLKTAVAKADGTAGKLDGLSKIALSTDAEWNISGNLTDALSLDVGVGAVLNIDSGATFISSGDVKTATGASKSSIIKKGAGTLTLAGSNKWEVPLSIDAGSVELAASAFVPAKSVDVAVGAGTTLTIADKEIDAVVGSLTGKGTVAVPRKSTLIIAKAGKFEGTLSGAGDVVISKDKTIELAGTNTYTGGTFVDKGAVLKLSAPLVKASDVTLGAGASLDLAVDLPNKLTLLDSADISVASGKTGTLSGTLVFSTDANATKLLRKVGPGTLVLADSISTNTRGATVLVTKGTLSAQKATAFNEGIVLVYDGATLKVPSGFDFDRVKVSFDEDATFESELTSANTGSAAKPVATFDEIYLPENKKDFILSLSLGDVAKGAKYTLFKAADIDGNPDCLVYDAAGNDLTDAFTFEDVATQTTNTLYMTLTKDVDAPTLSPSLGAATAGTAYTGTITVNSKTGAKSATLTKPVAGLTVALGTDGKTITVTGDTTVTYPAKFTILVSTKGDDDNIAGTITKEYELTTSATPVPEPEKVEPDKGLTADTAGKLFSTEPGTVEAGNAITVTFQVGADYRALIPEGDAPITLLFTPAITPVPVASRQESGSQSFKFTVPAAQTVAGLQWGYEFKGADGKTYRLSPSSATALSITPKPVTPSDDDSGGGCDAGFAGLALLLAAPLFLRKKSK